MEALRLWKYIPYTALSFTERTKAQSGAQEWTLDGNAHWVQKGLDRRAENTINMGDWLSAARALEEKMREIHGDERAIALASHHRVVERIAQTHTWEVARAYDIQQREIWVNTPEHDISTLDPNSLTAVALKISLMQRDRIAPNNAYTHPTRDFSSFPNKRSNPSNDFAYSPRKTAKRVADRCFRCGATGHIPSSCSATTTVTGQPTATVISSAKSKNGLARADGRQFCFNYARFGSCSFGNNCVNLHSCSVCGGTHGAALCVA